MAVTFCVCQFDNASTLVRLLDKSELIQNDHERSVLFDVSHFASGLRSARDIQLSKIWLMFVVLYVRHSARPEMSERL